MQATAAPGSCVSHVLAFVLLAPSTSFAQQSLNFSFGGFVPTSEDSRSDDDVLVNNL